MKLNEGVIMKGKLICIAFTLLTILTVFNLAPVEVFAQEEDSDIGEKIMRIEGILEQMNERLKELNNLGERIDSLQNSVGERIDNLQNSIGERIDNLQNNINLMWCSLIIAILGSPIILAIAQKRLK